MKYTCTKIKKERKKENERALAQRLLRILRLQ
jgi:hypothetical protein